MVLPFRTGNLLDSDTATSAIHPPGSVQEKYGYAPERGKFKMSDILGIVAMPFLFTERKQILDVSDSAQFRDLSPKQIVPHLADQGVYLASESSFYRVLKEHKMVAHRQSSKPAVQRQSKEHVATGHCQVWSRDITHLKTPVRGLFFYLYMIVDVWSRKIIAAQVFAEESMDYSSMLFAKACLIHGVKPEGLALHFFRIAF